MRRGRIGLVTGPVGMGKTTVAERVVGLARRRGMLCGGLLAPAMTNSCGQKAGIWGVEILSTERRILARTDRDLRGPKVGPYSFDATALAWAGDVVEAAIGACDLLIVDEIGKLELWRGIGLAPILPRLASGEVHRSLVLVRDFLLPELQSSLCNLPSGIPDPQSDACPIEQLVFEVSEESREGLPQQILDRLLQPSGA